MPRSIVATVQRKGGVGKTTIAVCLSGELHARGKRVTLIDADPQQSSLHWATPKQLPFTVRDLPFCRERPTRWIKSVAAPSPDDFTIIDTATTEEALRAAVLSARLILLPCTPSGIDIEATIDALYFVNCVRVENRLHVDALLVPNRVDMRTLEGRQFLEVLGRLGEDVAPSLGNRTPFVRAFTAGHAVNQYAPGSVADDEMKALADVVERRVRIMQKAMQKPVQRAPHSTAKAS
jgi:chromosome partitioning protein